MHKKNNTEANDNQIADDIEIWRRKGIPDFWWRDLQFPGDQTLLQPKWTFLSLICFQCNHFVREIVSKI